MNKTKKVGVIGTMALAAAVGVGGFVYNMYNSAVEAAAQIASNHAAEIMAAGPELFEKSKTDGSNPIEDHNDSGQRMYSFETSDATVRVVDAGDFKRIQINGWNDNGADGTPDSYATRSVDASASSLVDYVTNGFELPGNINQELYNAHMIKAIADVKSGNAVLTYFNLPLDEAVDAEMSKHRDTVGNAFEGVNNSINNIYDSALDSLEQIKENVKNIEAGSSRYDESSAMPKQQIVDYSQKVEGLDGQLTQPLPTDSTKNPYQDLDSQITQIADEFGIPVELYKTVIEREAQGTYVEGLNGQSSKRLDADSTKNPYHTLESQVEGLNGQSTKVLDTDKPYATIQGANGLELDK